MLHLHECHIYVHPNAPATATAGEAAIPNAALINEDNHSPASVHMICPNHVVRIYRGPRMAPIGSFNMLPGNAQQQYQVTFGTVQGHLLVPQNSQAPPASQGTSSVTFLCSIMGFGESLCVLSESSAKPEHQEACS